MSRLTLFAKVPELIESLYLIHFFIIEKIMNTDNFNSEQSDEYDNKDIKI